MSSTKMELTTSLPTADILAKIDEEIKALKKVQDSPYKTAGVLSPFPDIRKETNLANLIRAFASVQGRHDAYEKSADELGLTSYPPFEVDGGNLEDWKQDITLRINIISYEDRYKKLKSFKDKMTALLSQDEQKSILLKEMQDFLNTTTK